MNLLERFAPLGLIAEAFSKDISKRIGNDPYRSYPLTAKQRQSRAASKRARKARRVNRNN